jgi:hypothetical protein
VDESTLSFAVAMFTDWQNGQFVGGGSGCSSFTVESPLHRRLAAGAPR